MEIREAKKVLINLKAILGSHHLLSTDAIFKGINAIQKALEALDLNDRLNKDIELLEFYLKNTRNDVLVLKKQLAKMLDVERIAEIIYSHIYYNSSPKQEMGARLECLSLAKAIVNELGKGE